MLKKTFMLKKCFICLQGEYSLSTVMILKGHEQKGITKIYFFSIDSVELKVQFAPFALNVI